MENWTVKSVDGVEPKSAQEREAAVVEAAVADQPNVEIENNEPVKVNLDEPKKKEDDALQQVQGETAEGVLRDKRVEPTNEEVPDQKEITNGEENDQQTKEQDNQEQDDSPLELISETETNEGGSVREDSKPPESTQQEKVVEPEPQRVLPEDVDKLIAFMEETGGSVQDYARLNRDLEQLSAVDTIREYYREKYPHMSEERIERKMNKAFLYDEATDEPDVIQDRKDAFEDELYDARNYLQKRKDKYYADLKLRKAEELTPELKEASEFYDNYKQTQATNEKLVEVFRQRTDTVFNDEFKGFDFNVGDAKYRFKVSEPAKVKQAQLDLNNFINRFTDDSGAIADAAGYHKALFAANNADKLAQHFYEQGKADAVRQAAKDSKNIDMQPRNDASSVVTPSGTRVRVVSGDDSGRLRIKLRK